MWVGEAKYMGGEWARLRQMRYTRAEDEGIWAGMVGSDWEGEEAVKKEPPPPPTPEPTTPSSAPTSTSFTPRAWR